MQKILLALIVGTLVLGVGYWYQTAHSRCRVPILYDIGTIDQAFGLSPEEARAAITDAESLWEDATGRNLFTYTEGADFVINFLYDERQQETVEEQGLREVIDQKGNISESIRAEYEALVATYEPLRAAYAEQIAEYEERLAAHNDEVAYWNDQGGAPEEVYGRLSVTEEELRAQREQLHGVVDELNQLVDAINRLGEQGNTTVRDYNANVERYNERYAEEREFTQGDYQGDRINIYQFSDREELVMVLAHELGHALSLEHVSDPSAVMYFLMEGQLANQRLSEADMAEFGRVCGLP